MSKREVNRKVFINCPFDEAYLPLRNALIYALMSWGYEPLLAETRSSAQSRLDQIIQLIATCSFSIHDLCRAEPSATDFPRFNMPFELGIDLGCLTFGNNLQKKKSILVVDTVPYRIQKVLSDFNGNDIRHHNDDPAQLIEVVRDWLIAGNSGLRLPSPARTWMDYNLFLDDISQSYQNLGFTIRQFKQQGVTELMQNIRSWLKQYDRK